ncbi:MAG: glycosyltransferase family 2 protein [Flavobacteriales bacterium]
MLISVVSPVYRAENIIHELVSRIIKSVETITPHYEIILVEDGSPDKSWEEIEKAVKVYPQIKGIKLSRNFGQHHAISAGLSQCKGEWIVVMDCDLQDQPEEIIKLYNKAQEGYSIVLASRSIRNDSWLKRTASKLFYKTLGYLTDTVQTPEVANFGLYHKKVIQSILSLNDYVKYFPTMVKWVGFKSVLLEVDHAERFEGKSSYNIKKLLKLAINVIISFSDKPLRLIIRMGLLISCIALIFILYYFIQYINGQIKVLGYVSTVFSIWFLFGTVLTVLGMLGLYIGKIFDQVKNRPVFIIEKNTSETTL